ncbi:MAG: omptin family outer membrane protease [Thermodesulfobacteriota bacterium]
MRPSFRKTVVGLLVAAIIGLPAGAGELFQADVSAGCGAISGDTEYRIGGRVRNAGGTYVTHFPVSKLDFPIDAYVLSLNAEIAFLNSLVCSFSWATDLSSDPDDMRDYDWIDSPDELTIYSESDLDMETDTLSGKIQYRFPAIGLGRLPLFFSDADRLRLLAGAGYLYRQLDFEAGDTWQTYPGGSRQDVFVPGRTLNYSVEYRIPFLELGARLETADNITVECSAGYSPYVDATDKDRHLTRNLTSRADCDGDAWLLSFRGSYPFLERWYGALSLSQIYIEADGTADTYINDSWSYSIEEDMESDQFTALLEVGVRF